ncbi:hypothetical protein [Paenibacillus apiarius]|uniref:YfhD family protein n=1 Tax=Paenibacillus apiarius TaxID=46240 RepID=A0ABT4DQM0_9BACL|nr:hypothetical protein [Paenibacillus apiarius]MCY9513376.1 hypothetical protein [Paenibacillus apiarius]MCY9519652.1 hypothetical protein [Paenibacillus apiarius]MCY9553292.1 hypothetical protein [Paenibacillus apiarius]MCY9557142.1 hypothetical protein [Paenibacillus apiarius]MCY9682117.1 hypothetical protein [Paenibacillus apiarius]
MDNTHDKATKAEVQSTKLNKMPVVNNEDTEFSSEVTDAQRQAANRSAEAAKE